MNNKMRENSSFVKIAIIAIFANIFFTFANAYSGDQGYWLDWIKDLRNGGLANFKGNYPPVYVLWLWCVAGIYNILNIPLQKDLTLKFLCLIPVYFSHLFLLRLIFIWLRKRSWSLTAKKIILLFTALNPALLLDGPVWGQVDLFPIIFVVLAFSLLYNRKFRIFSPLFFCISLLCKFQAIMFLPVLGAMYLVRIKKIWLGIPIALVGASLILLPFIVTGSLGDILDKAYLKAAGFYSYATYNAGNLWMLLLGNTVSDMIIPFSGTKAKDFPAVLLSAKYLGMFLFSIFSLFIFIKSLFVKKQSNALMFASFMALAFFTLLPQMHERYLLSAIPVALLWLAANFKVYPFVLFLTLISYINIVMINGIRGTNLWTPLSILCVATFILFSLKVFANSLLQKAAKLSDRILTRTWIPDSLLLIILRFISLNLWYVNRPVSLLENEILISELKLIHAEQEYRTFKINKSVDGNALRVGFITYKYGIGAHAKSEIIYELPENAAQFIFSYGIDAETGGSGEVEFIVELDNEKSWQSGRIIASSGLKSAVVNVEGKKTITLIIDPIGPNSYDHADWINAKISKNF